MGLRYINILGCHNWLNAIFLTMINLQQYNNAFGQDKLFNFMNAPKDFRKFTRVSQLNVYHRKH